MWAHRRHSRYQGHGPMVFMLSFFPSDYFSIYHGGTDRRRFLRADHAKNTQIKQSAWYQEGLVIYLWENWPIKYQWSIIIWTAGGHCELVISGCGDKAKICGFSMPASINQCHLFVEYSALPWLTSSITEGWVYKESLPRGPHLVQFSRYFSVQ